MTQHSVSYCEPALSLTNKGKQYIFVDAVLTTVLCWFWTQASALGFITTFRAFPLVPTKHLQERKGICYVCESFSPLCLARPGSMEHVVPFLLASHLHIYVHVYIIIHTCAWHAKCKVQSAGTYTMDTRINVHTYTTYTHTYTHTYVRTHILRTYTHNTHTHTYSRGQKNLSEFTLVALCRARANYC